jgi:hypothetical protein
MPTQEDFVARPIFPAQSDQTLRLDRRQLLGSVAAITATSIVPGVECVECAKPTALVNVTESSPAEISTWDVCATTKRRLEEIAQRNRIRAEAGLPLLCVTKELRRMKMEADAEVFRLFEAVHREVVWGEVLKPMRDAKKDPNWRPTSFMEGLGLQAKVSKILHERFQASRTRQTRPLPKHTLCDIVDAREGVRDASGHGLNSLQSGYMSSACGTGCIW